MDKWFLKTRNSILNRMILTFIIIISPLYIVGFFIYTRGLENVKNETFKSMEQHVSNYLADLEEEIQRIKLLQYDCLSDRDLNMLSLIPESLTYYEKSRAILRLQRRLFAIRNSSSYIQEIYAYIPTLKIRIPGIGNIDNLTPNSFDILKFEYSCLSQQMHYINGELILHASSVDIGKGINPLFTLEIILSPSAFQNDLNQMRTYEGSKILLLDPYQNYLKFSGIKEEEAHFFASLLKQQIDSREDSRIKTIEIKNRQYLLVYEISDYMQLVMAKFFPINSINRLFQSYKDLYLIFIFTVFLVILFFSISTYKMVHKPLLRLVKSFEKIEEGNFIEPKIEHHHKDEFGYLYNRFNVMVENLKILIDQVYKQKILSQRAELKQLQSQINPHFLFNSFFILQRMIIDDDKENAKMFSKQLGNYFKFITRNDPDEIALEMEVEHAKVYAAIQNMRFSTRLSVIFDDMPDHFRQVIVPRLILQPIIENAVEHGLKFKEKNGILIVQFSETESGLQITVEDNGGGMTDSKAENIMASLYREDDYIPEITAIVNIHRRLRLIFGPDSGLQVSRNNDGGLKVIINIGYKKKETKQDVPLIDR